MYWLLVFLMHEVVDFSFLDLLLPYAICPSIPQRFPNWEIDEDYGGRGTGILGARLS